MSVQLKYAREKAGVTAKELTEKADVSRSTLNNAERGIAIRYAYAKKLVNALNELAGTTHTVESLNIRTSLDL